MKSGWVVKSYAHVRRSLNWVLKKPVRILMSPKRVLKSHKWIYSAWLVKDSSRLPHFFNECFIGSFIILHDLFYDSSRLFWTPNQGRTELLWDLGLLNYLGLLFFYTDVFEVSANFSTTFLHFKRQTAPFTSQRAISPTENFNFSNWGTHFWTRQAK